MRFFTPELYLRYNAPDDAAADLADEEWERAIRGYREHLSKFSRELDRNGRVKDLAEALCLHDAELLSLQEDIPEAPTSPLVFFPFPVAVVATRREGTIINLVYFLWDKVGQASPPEGWPFSGLRTHWLYDEIDLERGNRHPPLYWHRILLSDGRVISIPFFDVIVQSFSMQSPEAAIITKRRA